MTEIKLENISNSYILRNISLTVHNKEFFVLLGPTGAGKTTLLNVIAGLTSYKGRVYFDGESVDKLPPHKRQIGYVFQNLALFPHLDVSQNIAYGLKVRKEGREKINQVTKEMIKLMKLKGLEHRFPNSLSGGERQRVALARALAIKPKILLLDEPLNNLDERTRKYLRLEFKYLQRKLGITTIFVTHDLKEAQEIGDRIGVIFKGELQQTGKVKKVVSNPKNKKIAEFLGSDNILTCEKINALRKGLIEALCQDLKLVIPSEKERIEKVIISPREIYISTYNIPGPKINIFRGIVTEINHVTDSVAKVKVKVGRTELTAETASEIIENLKLSRGSRVYAKIKLKGIRTI